MLSLFWIIALFAAYAISQDNRRARTAIKNIGIALGFGIVLHCARDPRMLYHGPSILFEYGRSIYSHFLISLSNTYVDLRGLVPSFYDPTKFDWIPLAAWLALAVFCAIVFLITGKDKIHSRVPESIFSQLGLMVVVVLLILTYSFFNIDVEKGYAFGMQGYKLYFQDEDHYGLESDGFWTRGGKQAGVLFYSPQRLSSLSIELSSEVPGSTVLWVDRFKQKVLRTRGRHYASWLHFDEPRGYPWKDGYLYSLVVYEPAGFVPYQLDASVKDNRYLGVFVRIAVNR
jgi:hypothetical protein